MCIHHDIILTGKVQGVWCRKYISDKAKSLGITGYTKNLPDGTVYVEAESVDPEKLKEFEKWLFICSPLSKVEEVIVREKGDCRGYTGFDIKK